jgi:hypothetical protein
MITQTHQAPSRQKQPGTPPRYGMILVLALFLVAGVALATKGLRGSGTLSGGVTLTPLLGDLVSMQVDVGGNVTHLGRSTVHIDSVADFSGTVPQPVPPSTGVITAANGDTLSFLLKWTVTEVAPGVFDVVGPFDVTGGTGRFRSATGSGDYRGLVDTVSGSVTAEISGDIAR